MAVGHRQVLEIVAIVGKLDNPVILDVPNSLQRTFQMVQSEVPKI